MFSRPTMLRAMAPGAFLPLGASICHTTGLAPVCAGQQLVARRSIPAATSTKQEASSTASKDKEDCLPTQMMPSAPKDAMMQCQVHRLRQLFLLAHAA